MRDDDGWLVGRLFGSISQQFACYPHRCIYRLVDNAQKNQATYGNDRAAQEMANGSAEETQAQS